MAKASATGAPASAPTRELRGVVERLTYQNAENGYTVARLLPERAGPEVRGGSRRQPTRHYHWHPDRSGMTYSGGRLTRVLLHARSRALTCRR